MLKHKEKYCPKCNEIFVCKVGDIANCQCTEVAISNQTLAFLANTDYDCLCKNCLVKIDRLVKQSLMQTFPTQKEFLIEGLHYYKENGYWVFTELYHILRGYCCKNNCRHCVYGFKK